MSKIPLSDTIGINNVTLFNYFNQTGETKCLQQSLRENMLIRESKWWDVGIVLSLSLPQTNGILALCVNTRIERILYRNGGKRTGDL